MLQGQFQTFLTAVTAALAGAACAVAVWSGNAAVAWPLGGLFVAAGVATEFCWRRHCSTVKQLRDAAASLCPRDDRFAASSYSRRTLGTAIDAVIAAARSRANSRDHQLREIELQLKAIELDRDQARAALEQLGESVRKSLAESNPAPIVARRHTVMDADQGREILRLKRDFVSLVSHKFRTPLASIKAYAEMLIDGEAGDEQSRQEFLDVIYAEADRLEQAIINVLTLARMDSGLDAPTRRPTSLGELAAIVVRERAARAATRQLTLRLESSHDPDLILADRLTLLPAIANLLDNALRYTAAGGSVVVRLSSPASDRTVTLEIQNSAPGISPKDLTHLFDSSECGDRTDHHVRSDARVQRGLGLELVQRVVEQVHGGRFWGRSDVQTGSVFGFTLDRAPIAAEFAHPASDCSENCND